MFTGIAVFLDSSLAGSVAAAFGFIGSLTLLRASWRTIAIRGALIRLKQARGETGEATVDQALTELAKSLSADELKMIEGESRLYLIGVAFLASSFILTFLREVI